MGSLPTNSRRASAPDLPRNLGVNTYGDCFRFLTLRNLVFPVFQRLKCLFRSFLILSRPVWGLAECSVQGLLLAAGRSAMPELLLLSRASSVLVSFFCFRELLRCSKGLQVASGLRNLHRPRVWIWEGRFGTILEHFGSSLPAQSRGASPPDPFRNL